MANIAHLKAQIHDILVDKLGEPSDADLVLIKREAQELGLDNRQFDRLLQEVYGGINWSKVRDEEEGKDRVAGEPILIFDVQVKSLNKLGEVLFRYPEKAMKYLKDDVFLKANVNYLSHQNIDIAMQYSDLFHSENDREHRYLKICYRLNPRLPYRMDGRLFASVEELLTEGFANRNLFNKLYKEYISDRLHIWLQAQGPERFKPESETKTVNSFLTLVYNVNPDYPIYIEKEIFHTPHDVIARALGDLAFWKHLLASAINGELFVWLEARGAIEWRNDYRLALDTIQADGLLSDEEKEYAGVQQLFYIIDPDLERPSMVTSQDAIENLSLAATKILTIPIWLSLKSAGFVKPSIKLLGESDGITVDHSQLVLFDLTGQKQGVINVNIDPQKLKKDKEYLSSLQVITPYQTLDLRIRVKTVFPLKALLFCIAKYSVFGALFFGTFRWLLSAGTGSGGSLPGQIIRTAVGRSLPDNYPAFYWVFIAMLICFGVLVRGIRKVERI